MSDERPRSSIEAAGRVAEDVVSGLKASPILLGLLVLNALGIGAAVWFLSKLAETNQARWDHLIKACLPMVRP